MLQTEIGRLRRTLASFPNLIAELEEARVDALALGRPDLAERAERAAARARMLALASVNLLATADAMGWTLDDVRAWRTEASS